MDVEDNLSLKKESQDLINLLREKWKKEGLYFDENCFGKTSLEESIHKSVSSKILIYSIPKFAS